MPELLERALLERAGLPADRTGGAAGANSGEPPRTGEETSMASTARPNRRLRRGLRLAVAGAAVVTALTVATAGASAPPVETQAPQTPRLELGPSPSAAAATGSSAATALGRTVGSGDTRPCTPVPGFLLDRGRLGRIDVPGAAQTQAVGVNNLGRVVGEYQNSDGTYHGFLWHKGRFVTIDLPGAAATSLVDINDRGQILGAYLDRAGGLHGLLLDRGRFTTFDAPSVKFTFPRDINNRGQIVGFTLDDPVTLAGARGFLLAKGVKGPFTPIDVPGAPRNLVRGLNDRGQLIGSCENTAATPTPPRERMQPRGTMPNMLAAR
jgi:probable HAF family extracellular repeat protein